MHDDTVTIQTIVKRATDFEQFRQDSGRRAYGMLYYLVTDNDVMVAHCISDHTDVNQLKALIKNGYVYIQSHK